MEEVTAKELSELLGKGGEKVTAKGEAIEVTPFKFGQLPAVLKHIGTFGASAVEGDDFNIVRAITESGESVIGCLMVATGKERAWFDDLEIDEGAALLAAVVKANSELFEKKILPLLGSMKLNGLKSVNRTGGPTPQPS